MSRIALEEEASTKAGQAEPEMPPIGRAEITARFDRRFDRVYACVGRRIEQPDECKPIVADVPITQCHLLFADAAEERRIAAESKGASDRVIERVAIAGHAWRDTT